MAEKATLMLEAAKKNEEIERLEASIAQYTSALDELPVTLENLKQEVRRADKVAHDKRKDELRARIVAIISKKRNEVEALVDTFPNVEAAEYAGRFEIKDLEAHLLEVYPAEMVEDYVCMNPIPIDDDEEAFRLYSSVEKSVMSLSRGGGLISQIFNTITDSLMRATDDPRVGLKAAGGAILFYIASIWFLPFFFLTAFAGLGIVSAVQGARVKGLLRKLYSVKLFLNTSYDEDIFAKNKGDIMREVDDFLEDAKYDYFHAIDELQYVYDETKDAALDKQALVERKHLEQSRDLANTNLQTLKSELEAILEQIEELEEAEKKKAERARQEYLETIKWERSWMEHVFIDVSPENRLVMMPFAKGNSCYYSKDLESLKAFSRIVVFQAMLRMHPEYASQVILDFKYMGGELTQFITLNGKDVKLCMSEDDLRTQQELITQEIRSRTKNILSSSATLDEFNALMASYNSTGEYYAIVHIFGLDQISSTMLNWFRNGPRVGYLFKFYWTVEEMQRIKDDLPISDIQDFYEIANNPIPRTAASVKRLVGMDS